MKRSLFTAALTAVSVLVPLGTATASQAASGGLHGPAHLASVAHNTETSTNWSGYAVQAGSKFTDVKGTWTVPKASCSGGVSRYAAFWVGIDGYSSRSVEQLGTDSDCTSHNTASYNAWYEMYPAFEVPLSASKYRVRPGDSIRAEVSVAGSQFTLSMHSSEGWTFSITKSGSGLKQSSAEWIAEAPEICSPNCQLASLANFGSVSFTGAEAATGGADHPISSFGTGGGPHEIVMLTSNQSTTRAQPSVLGSGGTRFSVAWKHS